MTSSASVVARLLPARAGSSSSAVVVLLRRLLRVEAALAQLGRGEELGVAAEQDVGATAGHVGGDRDAALAARPGR